MAPAEAVLVLLSKQLLRLVVALTPKVSNDTIRKEVQGVGPRRHPRDREKSILERQWDFYVGSVSNDQATKLDNEFYELGLIKREERLMALDLALSEITPADYCGPTPPNDVSSHPPFRGLPMYAFAWLSKEFKQKMYLKFAITEKGTPRLVLYSFHPALY